MQSVWNRRIGERGMSIIEVGKGYGGAKHTFWTEEAAIRVTVFGTGLADRGDQHWPSPFFAVFRGLRGYQSGGRSCRTKGTALPCPIILPNGMVMG